MARNAWHLAQSEGTLGDLYCRVNWLLSQVDMEVEFLRKLAKRKRRAVPEVCAICTIAICCCKFNALPYRQVESTLFHGTEKYQKSTACLLWQHAYPDCAVVAAAE